MSAVRNAVVIGANGFIGSHLVDRLVGRGFNVTAFDRFRSGAPSFSSREVRTLRGDFLDRSALESAVAGQDLVFHFLSTTTPATAQGDPSLDIRTNISQSVELFEACARASVGRVYFASTGGAIYGSRGDKDEFSEVDQVQPVSPYAIGKLALERYLDYFRATYGLQSTVLRISNPYGTRQKPDRKQGLIPIVLRQAIRSEPVTRFGDGSMTRDYIYVEDLVEMITRVVETEPREFVYNLGSGHGASVADVFESIERVTGRRLAIVERPTPVTFVSRVVLDIDRYRAEFGAVEFTSLDDGIELTYREMMAEDAA